MYPCMNFGFEGAAAGVRESYGVGVPPTRTNMPSLHINENEIWTVLVISTEDVFIIVPANRTRCCFVVFDTSDCYPCPLAFEDAVQA